MHNYGINDVSKHVNIARVNVASPHAAMVMQASYEAASRSRHALILVFLIAKITLNLTRFDTEP